MSKSLSNDFPSEFHTGKFICESKNRFLCTVNIDGIEEVCYIASSCRLDNFIDLRGKRVLLVKNTGKTSRTRYSVIGVKHKRNYIILNTSWANKAIDGSLLCRKFSFLGKRKDYKAEIEIDGYKADFFIPNSKTIIEVKSVIATGETAFFPTVFSERTLSQLKTISKLLENGYRGCFIVVSLNPYVKEIRLLQETECVELLKSCIDKGMGLKGFSCRLSRDGNPQIAKEIPICL